MLRELTKSNNNVKNLFLRCAIPVVCFRLILHLPNRKDPHPATSKFIDPIDIPPNLAQQITWSDDEILSSRSLGILYKTLLARKLSKHEMTAIGGNM